MQEAICRNVARGNHGNLRRKKPPGTRFLLVGGPTAFARRSGNDYLSCVETRPLAEEEGLTAHAQAVRLRLKEIEEGHR